MTIHFFLHGWCQNTLTIIQMQLCVRFKLHNSTWKMEEWTLKQNYVCRWSSYSFDLFVVNVLDQKEGPVNVNRLFCGPTDHNKFKEEQEEPILMIFKLADPFIDSFDAPVRSETLKQRRFSFSSSISFFLSFPLLLVISIINDCRSGNLI